MTKKIKMTGKDNMLLAIYRMGWKDCFGGVKKTFKTYLLQRAYDIGWLDYIVGDDCKSNDLQTGEEIVAHIRDFPVHEIEIDGVLCVPEEVDVDTVLDQFLEWAEVKGYSFGGGFNLYVEEPPINQS